jgi:hypothetical protein
MEEFLDPEENNDFCSHDDYTGAGQERQQPEDIAGNNARNEAKPVCPSPRLLYKRKES